MDSEFFQRLKGYLLLIADIWSLYGIKKVAYIVTFFASLWTKLPGAFPKYSIGEVQKNCKNYNWILLGVPL